MYCKNKIVHTIKEGDSLYKLSRQYLTTVSELIMGNPAVNPYNLQVGMKLNICPGPGYEETEQDKVTEDERIRNMERAWEEHVMLARMFLVSFIHDLPERDSVIQRMERNIGEIVKQFEEQLSMEERNQMRELFMQHEQIYGELLGDLRSGNEESYQEDEKRWYDVGRELVDLLSRANPAYRRRDLNRYMQEHERLLLDMAKEYWDGNFEKSMETYDIAREQAEELGRYLAQNFR